MPNGPAKEQRHIWLALLVATLLACAAVGAHAASKPETHIVVIEAMQFSPPVLEVKRGDRVTWQNKDAFPHTVTSDQRDYNSGEIPSGGSWTFIAKTKGSFPYSCTYHPTMKGMLIVK